MAKCYQYDASGYYAGEAEDYGLLPNNTTYAAPVILDGHIPRWTGSGWEQVEDHKGREGYVHGERTSIKDYGPLPAGWRDTPPPPTPEEALAAQKAAFTGAIQQRLDDFARTRGYDNALSCASYSASTNAAFAAEGQYIVEARDATWVQAYAILDAVLSGARPMPTMEDVMAELPSLAWPSGSEAAV
jgi:hypothetical protein